MKQDNTSDAAMAESQSVSFNMKTIAVAVMHETRRNDWMDNLDKR